jgi:uncharacterized membrane protein
MSASARPLISNRTSVKRIVALRRAFIGASIAWAAALPLATFASSRLGVSSVVYSLAFAVYAIGSLVCHQLPERSFHLWSRQMPVCARCTGIYAGAALAAIAWSMRRDAAPSGPRNDHDARVVLLAAIVPSIATLVFEWSIGRTPSNTIRALAGLPLGAAVSWIVIASAARRKVNVK